MKYLSSSSFPHKLNLYVVCYYEKLNTDETGWAVFTWLYEHKNSESSFSQSMLLPSSQMRLLLVEAFNHQKQKF